MPPHQHGNPGTVHCRGANSDRLSASRSVIALEGEALRPVAAHQRRLGLKGDSIRKGPTVS
jgi:hypothetical protein